MQIKGIVTQLVAQPDYEVSEELDGTMRGEITYEGDRQYLPTAPIIGDAHPDNPNLHCFARKTVYAKLGKCRVVCSYIGLQSDPTTPVYEFVGSPGEDPIETHPNFVSLLGGKLDAELNQAAFDPDTGEFLGFPVDAPNDLGGLKSYVNPSVTWRKTWWQTEAPPPTALGKIVPNPEQIILPPSCINSLGYNFTYRQVGFYYQVSQEYIGSGPNGWNKLIYK